MYHCTMQTNSTFFLTEPVAFSLPEIAEGRRLDAALAFAPAATGIAAFGMRARRRLWESCTIQVNGRKQAAGFCARAGDAIVITPLRHDTAANSDHWLAHLQCVGYTDAFIALNKPVGLHSAHIAGGMAESLESLLDTYWAHLASAWQLPEKCKTTLPPQLLTRLDAVTSGIVLGAFSADAQKYFRLLEQQGKVRKTYFAIVQGKLSEPLVIKNALRTANTTRTEVLAEEDSDPARHTHAEPLTFLDGEAGTRTTLVKITIRRGARHQIRCHLAHAGYPLVGEWLYPKTSPPEDTKRRKKLQKNTLHLHHTRSELPEFVAQIQPDWDLSDMQKRLLQQAVAST